MLTIYKNQSQCLYVSAFSILLLLIASEIRIPIGIVHVTLQTFVAYLLGLQLDKRSAINAGMGFIVVKMLTLPVLTYPSFGYIIGMGVAIPSMYYIRQLLSSKIATCTIGYIIISGFGILWLHNLKFVPTWQLAWLYGIVPFVLGDTIKIIISISISKCLEKHH